MGVMEEIPQDELEQLALETGISVKTLQDWAKDGFLRKINGPSLRHSNDELDREVIVEQPIQ
jgi:predicted site-specific integrase-resolvase